MQFRKKFGKANVTSLVERARRSITFDRGTEFTDWPYLQAGIGTQTWFCRSAVALAKRHRRKHQQTGQEMDSLVAKRMVKTQQMRWSLHGAQCSCRFGRLN